MLDLLIIKPIKQQFIRRNIIKTLTVECYAAVEHLNMYGDMSVLGKERHFLDVGE